MNRQGEGAVLYSVGQTYYELLFAFLMSLDDARGLGLPPIGGDPSSPAFVIIEANIFPSFRATMLLPNACGMACFYGAGFMERQRLKVHSSISTRHYNGIVKLLVPCKALG